MPPRFILAVAALVVWGASALAECFGATDPVRCSALEAVGICAALVGLAAVAPARTTERS